MNVLLYLLLSALLGASAPGKVEHGLRDRLQTTIGPVGKVQVEVNRGHRSPFSKTIQEIKLELADFRLKQTPGEGVLYRPDKDVMAGKINNIHLVSRRFEVEGLQVKEMQVSLQGLRYNLWKAVANRQLEVLGVRKCRGGITLEEAALNRFVAPRVKELEGFRLDLEEGRVRVSGWRKTRLRVSVPVVFTARLQPEVGRITLVEPNLRIARIPVPAFVARRVAEQANPIIDLNQAPGLPCTFQIYRVKVEPSLLTAEARILFRPAAAKK